MQEKNLEFLSARRIKENVRSRFDGRRRIDEHQLIFKHIGGDMDGQTWSAVVETRRGELPIIADYFWMRPISKNEIVRKQW